MQSQHIYAAAPERTVRAVDVPRVARAAEGFAPALVFWTLLGSLAVTTALMMRAGLTVTIWTRSNIPYVLAAVVALGLRSRWIRGDWPHARALRDCAGYYLVFTAMALVGALTSYPIAALTHGYADAVLARSDAALGFDWVGWYETVSNHRILQWLENASYQSIYLTPIVLLGWFALTGQRREAHRFLATFWLAAVITLVLFSLMPAVGPLSYLWHKPIGYMPVSELWQHNLIPALRARTVHSIELSELRGLVSAPSFHAAAGALYLRTAWRAGPTRWPLVWLACAMLIATPVEGTHYLTDMILGAGVAVLAMAIVDALLARIGTTRRTGMRRPLAAA